MNEQELNELNEYLDRLEKTIIPPPSRFTAEQKNLAKQAIAFKRYGLKPQPAKLFANQLQNKLTNQLRALKPQRKKFMSETSWKIIYGFGTTALIAVIAAVSITFLNQSGGFHVATTETKNGLPRFTSCQALTKTIHDNSKKVSQGGLLEDLAVGGRAIQKSATTTPTAAPAAENAADYSQTNIQVAGVDEADTVKTDGTYIYNISGTTVYIAKAFPVTEAKVIGKISFTSNSTPQELFIDGKNLMVFGLRYDNSTMPQAESSGSSPSSGSGTAMIAPDIYPYYGSTSVTFAEIYDLTDPAKPELKRKLEFEGSYNTSRKIGDYVYFVLNSYPDYRLLSGHENTNSAQPLQPVPLYRDQSGSSLDKPTTSYTSLTGCTDVAYIEPTISNQYLSVIGLPINDYSKEVAKEVMLGSSQNIYASLSNLYIANTAWDAYEAGFLDKITGREPAEKTTIYKFNLAKDKITYQGTTQVPGTILNQFSMDEDKDYFRIATTTGYVSQKNSTATNNVYVLDKNLKQVGALTDLAPGEKFYSTRFMGDRAYLVTFKKVDPLFTVDLSDPTNPKVLGQLKIPGYSDYLHPYDDNHLIGIGKEAVEAEEGDFAWYQGLKMAIFDVTDVANPKEMFKVTIGDRGTDSPVLTDHKAFLFSKEKNLLVIPVTLAELTAEQKAAVNNSASAYGQFVYQGSYVYDITLDKGFVLKSRITHNEGGEALIKSGYYYGGDVATITRNLFIDGSLYSISQKKIGINSLTDLAEQGSVELK